MKPISLYAAVILYLLAAGLGSAAAQESGEAASAADTVSARAESDTVSAAAPPHPLASMDSGAETDSTEAAGLVPKWEVRSQSDMSKISLGSTAKLDWSLGGGWTVSSTVGVTKTKYRTRDMEDINQKLMNSALKIKPGEYQLSFRLGEDYRTTKTLSLSRFGKNIVYENERAGFNFQYTRPILGANKSIFAIGGDYVRGLHDFKYDRQGTGSASGHLSYSLGDNFSVGGGYGTNYSTEASEIGPIEFEALPSTVDTFKVNLGYRQSEDDYVIVKYERKSGDIRRVEPPRGNTFEVLDNPELAKEENIEESGEMLSVASAYRPVDNLSVEVSFNHRLDEREYSVDRRLSKKTETDQLKSTTTYKFSERGSLKFLLTKKKTDMDYGPVSVSSYLEDEDKLNFQASQQFGDDFSLSVDGSTYLKQRFYKRYEENPRDVDYYYYGGSATMMASPFRNVDTNVEIVASRYETRNIDASLSGDNRVEYIYRLMPGLVVRPYSWLSLSQDYEVKIEYTEFSFDENRNYIDRTTVVGTSANITPDKSLVVGFKHRYDMRDTGNYYRVGGEDRYNRTSEDFKHELSLDVDYKPVSYLNLFSRTFFRTRKNNILGVQDGERIIRNSNIYDSGTLKLGFSGNREVMTGGEMKLDVAYVNNFGYRISEAMKEYWEVDMKIEVEF